MSVEWAPAPLGDDVAPHADPRIAARLSPPTQARVSASPTPQFNRRAPPPSPGLHCHFPPYDPTRAAAHRPGFNPRGLLECASSPDHPLQYRRVAVTIVYVPYADDPAVNTKRQRGADCLHLPPLLRPFEDATRRSSVCGTSVHSILTAEGEAASSSLPTQADVVAAASDAQCVIVATFSFVVVYDGFPKASRHLLVLPGSSAQAQQWASHAALSTALSRRSVAIPAAGPIGAPLPSPSSSSADGGIAALLAAARVSPEGLHVLDASKQETTLVFSHGQLWLHAMAVVAEGLCSRLTVDAEDPAAVSLQCGFHSVPSMQPLHLHVMTTDLERSPNMKTKKHYNSFAPHLDFFIPLRRALVDVGAHFTSGEALSDPNNKGASVWETVVSRGKTAIDQPLQCWRCAIAALSTATPAATYRTLPELLTHLREHR